MFEKLLRVRRQAAAFAERDKSFGHRSSVDRTAEVRGKGRAEKLHWRIKGVVVDFWNHGGYDMATTSIEGRTVGRTAPHPVFGQKQQHKKEHKAWVNMLLRCYDPRCKSYPSYGGRGVTVCDRWRESFWAFLEDVGKAPTKDHAIDRMNPCGDYVPGNVRWASPGLHQLNRRPRVIKPHAPLHCNVGRGGRRRRGEPPPYLLDKSTMQSYATINGKKHYFGKHDSPESRRRYKEFLRSCVLSSL